jgi:hypothetical protein
LRNLVEKSVLESDNVCSDFSEDETDSEVNSIGSDDESNEDSDEKNDDAPGTQQSF